MSPGPLRFPVSSNTPTSCDNAEGRSASSLQRFTMHYMLHPCLDDRHQEPGTNTPNRPCITPAARLHLTERKEKKNVKEYTNSLGSFSNLRFPLQQKALRLT